jgi:hypothetical protein
VGLLVLGEDLIEGLVGFRGRRGLGGIRVRHEGLQPQYGCVSGSVYVSVYAWVCVSVVGYPPRGVVGISAYLSVI